MRRRAGGRNRYNARRRLDTAIRRIRLLELLKLHRLTVRGTQARLARELRVSEATVSRDVKALLYSGSICHTCGHLLGSGLTLQPIRTGRRALGHDL
jgi:hypothetical protein